MGDFVDIQTEVQRRSTEDSYTMMIRSGSDISMEEHMERYEVHVDGDREWRKHMEEEWWQRKTCGIT